MDDISEINETLWSVGQQRTEIIRALATQRTCSRQSIFEAAKTLHISTRYIYRLIRNFRTSEGLLTSLIPKKPDGGKGKSRLPEIKELLVNDIIDTFYLTSQKLSPACVVQEVRKQCLVKSIYPPPSKSTIRRRLHNISNAKLSIRDESDTNLEPIVGCFPKVNYPLEVVQIDHTLVDVILVDSIDRLPIGRPYLTLAIDVYSRCIAGFVLSLEAPSAVSVGLCLTHIAMKKDLWMTSHEVDASWPIHGKPKMIYVDNGSDFHSAALMRGCDQHGIRIEYRPIGKAHYGGIIERVIGTFMTLVHTLPGTTFSNIEERGNYNSDEKACLTLAELERWMTIAITKYYHQKVHDGIHHTPIRRYESGVEEMKKSAEEFAVIQNEKAFLIDFLPIIHRTLRRDGFVIDHIAYYNNALRPLISERIGYEKFLIRRDPRDLSRIYVCLPEEIGYLEVPYRALNYPAISLFEHRFALKRLKENGKKHIEESYIFKVIDDMRSIVKAAFTTTRSVRRNRARMGENQKIQSSSSTVGTPAISPDNIKKENVTIVAFTDIKVWE